MINARPARPRIVIVTPVHNEAANLPRYERAVRQVLLERADLNVHVLFVEDGSRDDSWALIENLCRRNARFRGLRLSRNFGSHAALSAGLHQADGDALVILACDLQDPPQTVLDFIAQWRTGAQIVWGRRRTRTDSRWRIWASRFFEGLTRRYAMPQGSQFTTGSFLLMDRRVLHCYRQFQENNRITFALVAYTGFAQAVVDYDRQARLAGKSSWNLNSLVKAAYDTFLSFSRVPFGMVTAVGATMFFLSIPVSIYLLSCYFLGDPKPGWTSIMLGLVMFFGLQFMFMSFLGEYIARIYSEVVRRPLYFISEQTADSEAGKVRDAA